jgi:hypothetical protein
MTFGSDMQVPPVTRLKVTLSVLNRFHSKFVRACTDQNRTGVLHPQTSAAPGEAYKSAYDYGDHHIWLSSARPS